MFLPSNLSVGAISVDQEGSSDLVAIAPCPGRLGVYNEDVALEPPMSVRLATDRYQLVGDLGSGSFGSVVMAKIKLDAKQEVAETQQRRLGTMLEPIADCHPRGSTDLVAIKIMTKKLGSVESYARVKELIFILSVPSHANLLQVFDVFIDKASFKLHLVLETMNQNLYQLMKARKGRLFSRVTLRSVLGQLLAAVRHIHSYGFFHRDIKPENILVANTVSFYGSPDRVPPHMRNSNYVIKLADYGLARHVDNSRPFTSYVSTRWYRSPEILLRKGHYSYGVDVWAFGCVAVEAANFRPLFPGQNELDQTWKVLEVCGCPEPGMTVVTPLGGYWDEAQALAARLGFSLPHLPGCSIQQLLTRTDRSSLNHDGFYNLVLSCLTWNPDSRISSFQLANLDYFNGTVLRTEEARFPRHPILGPAGRFGRSSLQFATDELPTLEDRTNMNEKSLSDWKKYSKLRKVPHFNVEMFKDFKFKQELKERELEGSNKDGGENGDDNDNGNDNDEYYTVDEGVEKENLGEMFDPDDFVDYYNDVEEGEQGALEPKNRLGLSPGKKGTKFQKSQNNSEYSYGVRGRPRAIRERSNTNMEDQLCKRGKYKP